jgi:hypothetical protein
VSRVGPQTFREGSAVWKALAVIGLLGILVATMYPTPSTAEASRLTSIWCLVCGSEGGVDVLLNVILFLPFALGLRLSGMPTRRVVLISAMLSFCVETIQFAGVPGRDASLSDLLTNTLGGTLGATLGPLVPVGMFPTSRIARRFLSLGAGVWLSLLALSAWLMTPWVPEATVWSRWAQHAPWLDPFHGQVTSAAAAGLTLPEGRVSDLAAEKVRRQLRTESLALTVEVVSGPPPDVRAWVYLLEIGPLVLPVLRQEGTGLYLSTPARSVQFRLRAPTLALPHGFPQKTGDRVVLNALEQGRRLQLSSIYDGTVRSSEVQLSPAQGWQLIAPFGLTLDRHEHLITGLSLVIFLLPLGYWAAHDEAMGRAVGVLAGTLVLGLGLLPFCFSFAPVHWSEWAAALVGMTAGWALHRPAAYLETRCASPSISEFSSS